MKAETLAKGITFIFALGVTLLIFSLMWFHDGTQAMIYVEKNQISKQVQKECFEWGRNTYCDMRDMEYNTRIIQRCFLFFCSDVTIELCKDNNNELKLDMFDDYFYLVDQCVRNTK